MIRQMLTSSDSKADASMPIDCGDRGPLFANKRGREHAGLMCIAQGIADVEQYFIRKFDASHNEKRKKVALRWMEYLLYVSTSLSARDKHYLMMRTSSLLSIPRPLKS